MPLPNFALFAGISKNYVEMLAIMWYYVDCIFIG